MNTRTAALLAAAAFAALLMGRLALPLAHRAELDGIGEELRNIPIHRTEAHLADALARAEALRDRIAAERTAYAAACARLNLALALSGIASAALAAAAYAGRKPPLPAPDGHPATTPTDPGHGAPPG